MLDELSVTKDHKQRIYKIETKFDADPLLLKIGHISCKKTFAASLKHNLTKAH